MIVIVGAGIAGLSAAYHLRGRDYQLFEGEPEVGGLCRSQQRDGFTFDLTGHLLHFKDADVRRVVERLLPDQLSSHTRRSSIYSNGVYTEYPFQVNTHGLPTHIIAQCVGGFLRARLKRRRASLSDASLKTWIVERLGRGIADHFMVPFNEKLWGVPLEELSRIPRPDRRGQRKRFRVRPAHK